MAAARVGAADTAGATQVSLADKRREANVLKAKLLHMRLMGQHLRARLLAVGVSSASVVPGQIVAGAGAVAPAASPELRSLLEWLAEAVDLTRQVTFECGAGGAGVAVGGRRVLLQRMAAMPLGGCEQSRLQLSVPLELQAEITSTLARVRARGGRACETELARVAERWELVGAEMVSAATGQQEPAIFLVHRDDVSGGSPEESQKPARAIVVAQWPSVDFAKLAAASSFTPARHFQKLCAAPSDDGPPSRSATLRPQLLAQAQALPQGAQGAPASSLARAPPPPVQALSPVLAPQAHPPMMRGAGAEPGGPDKLKVCTGDRVVIKYRGQWFRGVLKRVDVEGNVANVKCDTDMPGVITIVPLASVWPAASPPEESQWTTRPHEAAHRQILRHVRARTVG